LQNTDADHAEQAACEFGFHSVFLHKNKIEVSKPSYAHRKAKSRLWSLFPI
jgi:hypothetical protein